MKLQGNTILITGGASGIGLGLAEEFKRLGNEVLVAGRSAQKLEMARAKGLVTFTADMTSENSLHQLAEEVTTRFPALNVVIHNAGIMVNEKLTARDFSSTSALTVATNLMAPIILTNTLLPHFLKKSAATIMTVTSGLAYVPLALTPTYSATKAAIHSYTQSLRYQLQNTSVEVKELVPPYVRTGLMGERQKVDQNAMPLDEFIAEVFTILKETPKVEEITVKRVLAQRLAGVESLEKYNEFFKAQNDRLLAARRAEWDTI